MNALAAREALRGWRQRRVQVAADRDRVVLAAVQAGLSDPEIAAESGIGRTTVALIRDPGGALAVAEKARRALRNRGIHAPAIWAKGGQVRLSLPYDAIDLPVPGVDEDPGWFEVEVVAPLRKQREDDRWIERMNWAGAIIAALREAHIAVSMSDEPEGSDLREHLAHRNEQHAVLTLKEES